MAYNNLKNIRDFLKFNQKEFAESLGINSTTYNNYENGTREPKSDFLGLLYKKYGISSDYVLGLSSKMFISNPDNLHAEKAPETTEAETEAFALKLYQLLIDTKVLLPGQDLTVKQLRVLQAVCDIIDASFDK